MRAAGRTVPGPPEDGAPPRLARGVALALVLAALALPGPARAQAVPDPVGTASAEELRGMVRALARRVEELERRLGAAPGPVPVPAPRPAAPAPTRAAAAPTPPPPPAPQAAPAPTRPAPGQLVVDEEAVERALEQALVQTGALLLEPGTAEVRPSLGYVRSEGDEPGLVFDDGRAMITTEENRTDAFSTGLTLRLGLPLDLQLEAEVPYGLEERSRVTRAGSAARDAEEREGAGLGDVSLGLAKGLARERGWWPDLIGRVEWDTDTGRTDDGIALGSGFHELTGSLTAAKRQDPLVFVGTVSYGTSLEAGGVDPGDRVGLSLGAVLAASPETSLRFFLAQGFAREAEVDGQEVEGSDRVGASLVLGASSALPWRTLLDVSVGVGLTGAAPDYSLNVSLPVRFDLPARLGGPGRGGRPGGG